MGHQDCVKGIWHKEVCLVRIGLMHVYYLIHFYYLLLFVIHVSSFDKLRDLPMHLSLHVMRCISAELFHACQTVGIVIGKWLPD